MDYLALYMFPCLLLFIMTGYPVAFVLSGISIAFALLGYSFGLFYIEDLGFIPSRVFGVVSNLTLMAVPIFIFMGHVLEKSGIAERLLKTISAIFSKQASSLPIAVVIVGAILAASTGIVGATVVTMGILSLPLMLERGYPKSLATGTIVASGTLGQIIPPSIVLIILAEMMNLEVGDVFAAAIAPGFLLVACYIIYLLFQSKSLSHKVKPIATHDPSLVLTPISLMKTLGMPLGLISIVLGSILTGLASPTEAAACGVAGAVSITLFGKGRLSWSDIYDMCLKTARTSAMVFWLLIGAQFFGVVFRGLGGDELIVHSMEAFEITPALAIAMLMVSLFILGFFLDFLEICFIIVPIILPIMTKLQVDPLWLCILIAINLQTSFLTPPFGFALFYLKGVAPKQVKTMDIYRGIIPFVGLQIFVLILIISFPKIATFLPELIFGD